MLRLLIALLLALAPGVALAAPPVMYVVRHLHTPAGERDPDLTAQGAAVAATLPAWFRGKPLTTIYITDFKRMRQTAAPLAAARKLNPLLYDMADTPTLIARVKAETGPVLVIGHSNTVPDIVAALGGTRPALMTHPDFGDIWTITPSGSTRAKLP